MTDYQNFHPGEAEAQSRWGVDTGSYDLQTREMFLPDINPQEHAFIDSLSFSMAASVDDHGRPWASPLLQTGDDLFQVEHSRRVRIAAQHSTGDDPLAGNVSATAQLSVVFFQPATRRRAKSIGTATQRPDGSLQYDLTRIFGICPKYIHKRKHAPQPADLTAANDAVVDRSALLNADDQSQLRSSDTIFFASHGPHGADVTHRGGRAGFVTVVDDRTLDIPDYPGNGMFNTLGNLVLDDRLGISDLDFSTGRTVHMTGRAEVRDGDPANPSAPRLVRFHVEEVRVSLAPVGDWTDIEASRYSPELATDLVS